MVSKEAGRCALSNSESDSESGGPTLGAEGGGRGDAVRKRNKALQVRFKDICEAQNEAARLARGAKGRSVSCKVVHRRYMTMPARRSIPNVTKSTAVQTSPDLKKRYQTFPFERKKGHTIKHTALVENYQGQNNGFLSDVKSPEEEQPCGGRVQKTRVLLHSMPPCSDVQDLCAGAGDCIDSDLCADPTDRSRDSTANSDQTDLRKDGRFQGTRESESQEPNCTQSSTSPPPPTQQPLQDRGGSLKVTGPIAWTSLTQVECLESPSVRCKRKKESAQFNGLQSQTLPHPPRCSSQETSQAHFHGSHGFTSRVAEETAAAGLGCGQVIPLPGVEGDVKARLQAMETLISSSQETIKVLLGVIQELEKGEAQREGTLQNRQDGQIVAASRFSLVFSVELDFKLQEDKLQPLMKRLCPTLDPPYPSLPYPHEVITSTPKRKSKSEAKKLARWKLWFL
uniref:Inhibitory synaptic factor 2A n=1 Tax=Astyanax mexicanus TaxID=7994 RepID=A0A8B9KPV1_ASTMX